MPTESAEDELLELNQALLEAIMAGDWEAYSDLCAADLTAFESESLGHLVEGMEFHRFYFDLPRSPGQSNVTMTSPRVRLLGPDAAVVAYVRLTQRLNAQGEAVTSRCEETRVWQRTGGRWQHVHFHRSTTP